MRNIFAILLILASIGIYYGYSKGALAEIKTVKTQLVEYKDSLAKAKSIVEEKQVLIATMDSFNQEDKDKLEKMIPNNADNVRLIIDIQNIAKGNGLTIQNIKVNEDNKQGSQTPAQNTPPNSSALDNNLNASKYTSVNLSFTVISNYANFVLFTKKLEQSLRLVDITALKISPSGTSPDLLNFDITLRAYWLK